MHEVGERGTQRVHLAHDVVVLLVRVLVGIELDLDARHTRADAAGDVLDIVQPVKRVLDLFHDEPLQVAWVRARVHGDHRERREVDGWVLAPR